MSTLMRKAAAKAARDKLRELETSRPLPEPPVDKARSHRRGAHSSQEPLGSESVDALLSKSPATSSPTSDPQSADRLDPAPFLRGFGWAMASVALVVALTNVVMDPKGYLRWVVIPGINETAYFADGGRVEKALELERGSYNALIAGTSRAQIGLDPLDPMLAEYDAYNAALAGTNVYEVEKVLRFAQQHQDVELLVWGLDFLAFSTNRTVRADFDRSPFTEQGRRLWALDYIFSFQEFGRSLANVYFNMADDTRTHSSPRGFKDKSGTLVEHRSLFEEVLVKKFLTNRETYAAYEYGEDRVRMLQDVVTDYVESGSRVLLFFSPIHAWQLETIRRVGLYEEFEQWKRELTVAVAAINGSTGSEAVELWDFSGYTSITMEAVPQVAEKDRQMKWYWESSHYRKALGSAILARTLDAGSSSDVPDDFGVVLTPENLERELSRTREAREGFLSNFAEDAASIQQLVSDTAPLRGS